MLKCNLYTLCLGKQSVSKLLICLRIVIFERIQKVIKSDTFTNNILLAASVGIGTSVWFLSLSLILRKYKSKVSETIIVRINQVSGYLFISFGLYLAYSIIS